jgi:general secretion pathway protein F
VKIHYEAVSQSGEVITGDIEAATEREAIRLLSNDGLSVLVVGQPEESRGAWFQRGLTKQEVALALFELAMMLSAGVALAEAIESQSQSEHHPELEQFFEHVSDGLRKGQSLSAAIECSELELPIYLVRLIQSGELSGDLPACMTRGVAQMEYELEISSQLKGALIYPAVLVFAGIAAVLMIFVFVVPKFSNLLIEGNDLPALAWFVLTAGMLFNEYVYLVVLSLALLVVAVIQLSRKKQFQDRLRDGLAELPVVGVWLNEVEIAKWSSVMAAMLHSRVELIVAMGMAQNSLQITRRIEKLEQVRRAVVGGESLSKALVDNRVLSPTAYNLIRAGEKSGTVPQMLDAVAKVYDASCKNRMKTVIALIEPIVVLAIGAVIGVLILGIILAITSVNTLAI